MKGKKQLFPPEGIPGSDEILVKLHNILKRFFWSCFNTTVRLQNTRWIFLSQVGYLVGVKELIFCMDDQEFVANFDYVLLCFLLQFDTAYLEGFQLTITGNTLCWHFSESDFEEYESSNLWNRPKKIAEVF